jgi:mono/diheme cytochrome c family protein
VELAEIDWELGEYDAARRRLQAVASGPEEDTATVWTAALACSLSGRTRPTRTMTDWLDSTARVAAARFDRRLHQLRNATEPQAASPPDPEASPPLPWAELLADDQGPSADLSSDQLAAALYEQHCAACHGDRGDGQGRAARHLFPPPRAFRTEPFRLVSTANGVATLDDVQQVIRQGMPGTSMPAYRDLPEEQVRQLAEWTLRMHREGMIEQATRWLAADGEPVDEQEVADIVKHRTTPGQAIRTPELGAANPESIRRGREVYVQAGCLACHGDDGTGAADVTLRDDTRQVARPRDLVHQPLKGGPELSSLYLRIVAGMPGTPHPAAPSLSPAQAAELVHYCRSLVQNPPVPQTNYQRQLLTDDPWN